MKQVRRADIDDALGIHNAHMRSIQEVCSNHHTSEEIKGWGHRPFNSEMWQNAIKNDLVWVVDDSGLIQGYAHLRIYQPDGGVSMHGSIRGLYLAPEALGLGFGFKLAQIMVHTARENRASEISLASTLTAHSFYEKVGFKDSGPQGIISIGGSDVRYFPMNMAL